MTTTDVSLVRNDGSEQFILKADRVEETVSNGFVSDSIISGVTRKTLGAKLVLELITYQVDITIQGVEATDYPNSSSYTDHEWGMRQELRRASLHWGYTMADGFDTLEYRDLSANGVLTEYSPMEDTDQRQAGTFTATIEWTNFTEFIP